MHAFRYSPRCLPASVDAVGSAPDRHLMLWYIRHQVLASKYVMSLGRVLRESPEKLLQRAMSVLGLNYGNGGVWHPVWTMSVDGAYELRQSARGNG